MLHKRYSNTYPLLDSDIIMSKMRFIKLCYFNQTFYMYIIKRKDLHSAKVTACVLLLTLLVKAFKFKVHSEHL